MWFKYNLFSVIKLTLAETHRLTRLFKAQLGKMMLRINLVKSQDSTCLEHNSQPWGCQAAQYRE